MGAPYTATGIFNYSRIEKTATGKSMVKATLRNRDGVIKVNIFEDNPLFRMLPPLGDSVMSVIGYVDDYGVRPTALTPVATPAEEFLQPPHKDKDVLLAMLTVFMGQLGPYDTVVRSLLSKHPAFYTVPAAKNQHHAYSSGLLEHTVNMLMMADHYMKWFEHMKFNRSLVFAGIILHDLGKVFVYTSTGSYIEEAAKVEHIAYSYKLLCLEQIDPALELELSHILLSHHDLKEYGSPVTPKSMEAKLVALVDQADAVLEKCHTQGFSEHR